MLYPVVGFKRLDPEGNRLSFGVLDAPDKSKVTYTSPSDVLSVKQLSMMVAEDLDPATVKYERNGAISELGFASGASEILKPRAMGFYLENGSLRAQLTVVIPQGRPIEITATVTFLGVKATVKGGLAGGQLLAARIGEFWLVNPAMAADATGWRRLSLGDIFSAIGDGRFFHTGLASAANGFLYYHAVPGDVGGKFYGQFSVVFNVKPFAGLPGLTTELCPGVNATMTAGSPAWLDQAPQFSFQVDSAAVSACYANIFARLKNLSWGDIVAALRKVVAYLRSMRETGDPNSALRKALDYRIPLVNRSVNDLLDITDKVAGTIEDIANGPATSLQKLNDMLKNALGIRGPPDPLSYDPVSGVLSFAFDLGGSTEYAVPFNFDFGMLGIELPGLFGGNTSLISAGGSGSINIKASARLGVRMGIDLNITSGSAGVFMKTGSNGTSFTAQFSATGYDLAFKAKLGPFGIFIDRGHASVAGTLSVALGEYKGSDDRGTQPRDQLYLIGYADKTVSSDIGRIADFVDSNAIVAILAGSVSLPMSIGTESHKTPVNGDPECTETGHPGTDTVSGSFTFNVGALLGQSGNPISYSITLPHFCSGLFGPSALLNLLSDPAVLLEGLDLVLGQIQEIVGGRILGFKLPFLGNILANNPVANGIGDLRLKMLQPLIKVIRENDLTLEGLAAKLQATLELALSDFGTPSVQLNLGTDSIEFRAKISKAISIRLADIDFDIGIPALGLAAKLNPPSSSATRSTSASA